MKLDFVSYEYLFELVDRLANWTRYHKGTTRDSRWYCGLDLYGIEILYEFDEPGTPLNREHKKYDIYVRAIANEKELKEYAAGMYTHPDDRKFWAEAIDWFDVGKVWWKEEVSLQQRLCVFGPSGAAISNADLLAFMTDLEKRVKERYPDVHIYVSKPSVQNGGCYVATAVYGNYDCPEVWTLRRFRDEFLKKKVLGRGFVRCYYAISPGLARRFGNKEWFNELFRKPLDSFVRWLQWKGYSDEPYNDR